MVVQVARFTLGLLTLLPSTRLLVKRAAQLASKMGISPLITGVTIVALGTSLPELVVSTIAAVNNDYGLALGNILGSNIANAFFVLPVGIVLGGLRIGTLKTQKTALVLLFVSIIYFLGHTSRLWPISIGGLLLGLGGLVTYLEYRWAVTLPGVTHTACLEVATKSQTAFTLTSLITLVIALLGITIGGLELVTATENIAFLSGYSTTTLGLTLTAISTSLPELLTTIFSQATKDEKLVLGTILGSNIYNLTIIGGISASVGFSPGTWGLSWLWFGVSTCLLVLLVRLFKNQVIPKSIGVCLLALFASYLYTLAYL